MIDAFLSTNNLTARDLPLTRVSTVAATASDATVLAREVASNSGRWIKLTAESARRLNLDRAAKPMRGSAPGISRAIVTKGGKTSHILQYSNTSARLLTNPAILTGAAGIMAQVAMQQAMDEITDYLKVIDAKVDAVLRAQKDAVFADMIGIEMSIDEALAIRSDVGHVSEVTWSKVQTAPTTITRTQAYALRQIAAHADRLEAAKNVGALADDAKGAAEDVKEWLAVIARCVQLHDAVAILELDRLLDAAPEDLDSHRRALSTARAKRLQLIAEATLRLGARVDAAAGTANAKVLFHPGSSKSVVESATKISVALADFHAALGVASDSDSVVARRWLEAVADVRDKTLEAGSAGVDSAKRIGASSVERARGTAGELSAKLTARKQQDKKPEDYS